MGGGELKGDTKRCPAANMVAKTTGAIAPIISIGGPKAKARRKRRQRRKRKTYTPSKGKMQPLRRIQ
jgi:hypothetical protein